MRVPIPVTLLLISLVLPIELSFYLGDLLITPVRVVLLFTAFPSAYKLFKRGDLRDFDYLLFGFIFWIAVSYTYNHGAAKAVEGGGVLALEILISYLIARVYITDTIKLIATIRLVVVIITLMLPFVIAESLTGKHIIHDFFASLTGFQYPLAYEARFGFTRAYGTFTHPILLGVFSSSLTGLVWYVFGKRGAFGKLLKLAVLSATTIATLSSAPLLLLLFQFFAIAGNRLAGRLRWKWQMVVAGFASLYVFLLFWSPYSPMMVIMSRITLDPSTSYYRRLIWEYGSAVVLNNPFFGIGKNDWVRPIWMVSDTIDNFWLKVGMQFGLPAVILLGLCLCLLIFKVSKMMKKGLPEDYKSACRGWIVTIISFSIIGFTVDFFGAIYVFFYFLLGMGAALLSMTGERRRTNELV